MARIIDADVCISCGTCAAVCPCDAINEGSMSFIIDTDICIDCGTCEPCCPVEAISPSDNDFPSMKSGDKFSSPLSHNNPKDKFKRDI